MGNLYFVRHGQASFGSSDYDQLSPLGLAQSELLGRWLACIGARPDRLACGTLKRHRQTAEACLGTWLSAEERPVPLLEDRAFDEFNHQEILLRGKPELAERGGLERFLGEQADPRRAFQKVFTEAVARWIAGRHDDDYGESWSAFRRRCVDGLLRMAESGQDRPDGGIWIFTSGGPIAAIIQHVLGMPDNTVLDLNCSVLNSSVTQFVYRRSRFRLGQFNNTAHLAIARQDGLMSYR